MRSTLHGRGGASVDFYRTVTGVPHVESVEDPHRSGQLLRVVRLERILELTTCSDCWEKAAVQLALKEARRTGLLRAP